MSRRIITLTTDFGLMDHLVGTMRGVILSIAPDTQVVDITHNVRTYDVLEGALAIGAAYRFYPPGTIHVVVVDPGVGTARRPLLVEAAGQFFIGPDNGVLSVIAEENEAAIVRHITAERYFLKPVSRTFHGRDIFSPSAAWLANLGSPSDFGNPVDDFLRFRIPRPVRSGSTVVGSILRADAFGNLMTNFKPEDLPEIFGPRPRFRIRLGAGEITRRVDTFAEGEEGEAVLLLGSSGYLEIIVNHGSAARMLGANRGAEVVMEFE